MQLEYGGQRVTIAAGELVIGSDPDAALRLAGPSVLPRHAVLRLAKNAHPVILPAAQEAVVEVNGTRIGREPTPLMHGDRIAIGEQEIRVSDPIHGGETRVLSTVTHDETKAEHGASGPTVRKPGPAARLVSLTDGREYSLDKAPFVLGRDAQAEVVIASPDASRRHAEIAFVPDGDVLVDLSANGTYVNGTRVTGRHRLKALDVIRIGAEEFRYYPAPTPSAEAPAAPPAGAGYRLGDTLIGIPSIPKMPAVKRPPSPKPLAVLLVKKGLARGQRFPVFTPTAGLGRAESNEIRLADPSVSASHGKLQLREGIWTFIDLGSTSGSTVDDIPVTDEAPLSPGTVIRIGEVELLFEPHDERMPREEPTSLLPKLAPPEPDLVSTAPVSTGSPAGPAGATGSVSEVLLPRSRGAASRPEPPRKPNRVPLLIGIVALLAALAALVFLL